MSINKNLYIISTKQEAKYTLNRLNMKIGKIKNLYVCDAFDIFITGIGTGNVMYNLLTNTTLLSQYQRWINIGIAGHINGDATHVFIEPSSLLPIIVQPTNEHVQKFSNNHHPLISLQSKSPQTLYTSDYPVFFHPDKIPTHLQHMLVDMEAYWIAWIANTNNKPLRVIKLISDFCLVGQQVNIKNQINIFSELICKRIIGNEL